MLDLELTNEVSREIMLLEKERMKVERQLAMLDYRIDFYRKLEDAMIERNIEGVV